MYDLKKELSEMDWIEIDYTLPLNDQISKGDLLITTNMFMFNGYGDDVSLLKDELTLINEDKFTVMDVEEHTVKLSLLDPYDDDDGWFDPEGRIFIKKKDISYTEILVPDFLVSQVLSMGGKTK